MELAVPAWHSGLTKQQAADIERVQKVALYISDCSTGQCEYTYDMALVILELEPLETRRDKLCLSFATKSLKSRHSDMFVTNGSQHDTRERPRYFEGMAN